MAAAAHPFEFFFRSRSPFSQWHRCKFSDGVNTYCSAEQYMMYQKAMLFGDEEIAAKILASGDQKKIKALGRKVKGFDEKKWIKHREEIVYQGNLLKFSGKLKKVLLDTGDAILVEASPYDKIWGIGMAATNRFATDPTKWKGLNLLGKALMRVRDTLNE